MIRMLWKLSRGYRLRPWSSPYLRWRIETWSGIDAAGITAQVFCRFVWSNRAACIRYLRWAAGNSSGR